VVYVVAVAVRAEELLTKLLNNSSFAIRNRRNAAVASVVGHRLICFDT
jgi:hypothetical protein